MKVLVPRIDRGSVGVSILTELEVGYSGRTSSHYRATRQPMVDRLLPIAIPYAAEARARDVQARLVERGQHRSAGVANLLLAATAEWRV